MSRLTRLLTRLPRFRTVLIAALAVIVIYFAMPVVAGCWEIGPRAGPRIYPLELHSALYLLGWDFSTHDAVKPRIPAGLKRDQRPWFYGGTSDDDGRR